LVKLYNVSIISKYDIWLKEDEENALNWVVMGGERLEQWLGRRIKSKENINGRAVVGYDDILWKKFL